MIRTKPVPTLHGSRYETWSGPSRLGRPRRPTGSDGTRSGDRENAPWTVAGRNRPVSGPSRNGSGLHRIGGDGKRRSRETTSNGGEISNRPRRTPRIGYPPRISGGFRRLFGGGPVLPFPGGLEHEDRLAPGGSREFFETLGSWGRGVLDQLKRLPGVGAGSGRPGRGEGVGLAPSGRGGSGGTWTDEEWASAQARWKGIYDPDQARADAARESLRDVERTEQARQAAAADREQRDEERRSRERALDRGREESARVRAEQEREWAAQDRRRREEEIQRDHEQRWRDLEQAPENTTDRIPTEDLGGFRTSFGQAIETLVGSATARVQELTQGVTQRLRADVDYLNELTDTVQRRLPGQQIDESRYDSYEAARGDGQDTNAAVMERLNEVAGIMVSTTQKINEAMNAWKDIRISADVRTEGGWD